MSWHARLVYVEGAGTLYLLNHDGLHLDLTQVARQNMVGLPNHAVREWLQAQYVLARLEGYRPGLTNGAKSYLIQRGIVWEEFLMEILP